MKLYFHHFYEIFFSIFFKIVTLERQKTLSIGNLKSLLIIFVNNGILIGKRYYFFFSNYF
jgi:hypothetical protein